MANSSEPTTKAVLSLVFGILAVAGGCPCIGGVLAIVLGMGEKSGVGRAGFILGWIHFALVAVIALLVLLGLTFGAIAAACD